MIFVFFFAVKSILVFQFLYYISLLESCCPSNSDSQRLTWVFLIEKHFHSQEMMFKPIIHFHKIFKEM